MEMVMRAELTAATLLASFTIVMAIMPILIIKLKKRGIVAIDYYKNELRKIPTRGGVAILAVVLLMFGLAVLLEQLSIPIHVSEVEWAMMLVVVLFGVFGAVDDFADVGRHTKIFLPFFFSFPLLFVIDSTTITLPFIGCLNFGVFYLILIVPIYVMVVANLVNMHSGFNGLVSGLMVIFFAFLLIKTAVIGCNSVFMLSCMLGATLGFFWYNRYPARIFLGNIGSLSIGAAVGVVIVAYGFLVSGFIMLIPHTVNFLMYVYWRLMHWLHPEDERWKIVKFGRVREDGTLEVPNCLTLKWVLPYYFRMTEKQAVLAMYALTMPFCLIALFIPY
ncbi:UDP-N-acetylglucosamine-1-phosphate transferase [Methanophagales archaeon]|nr:MAG: UDP-N-acetylglucosamine-1-phosphate transferase [Methanophagales archaeon]